MAEDLPTTLEDSPLTSRLVNGPISLAADAGIKEAKVADVEVLNDQLLMAYQAIPQVKSIGSFVVLSTFIQKTLKERRDALRIPYGTENKVSKSNTLDHID